jgi:hypothetical protein
MFDLTPIVEPKSVRPRLSFLKSLNLDVCVFPELHLNDLLYDGDWPNKLFGSRVTVGSVDVARSLCVDQADTNTIDLPTYSNTIFTVPTLLMATTRNAFCITDGSDYSIVVGDPAYLESAFGNLSVVQQDIESYAAKLIGTMDPDVEQSRIVAEMYFGLVGWLGAVRRALPPRRLTV